MSAMSGLLPKIVVGSLAGALGYAYLKNRKAASESSVHYKDQLASPERQPSRFPPPPSLQKQEQKNLSSPPPKGVGPIYGTPQAKTPITPTTSKLPPPLPISTSEIKTPITPTTSKVPPPLPTSTSEIPPATEPTLPEEKESFIDDLVAIVKDSKRHSEFLENELQHMRELGGLGSSLTYQEQKEFIEDLVNDSKDHTHYLAEQVEHFVNMLRRKGVGGGGPETSVASGSEKESLPKASDFPLGRKGLTGSSISGHASSSSSSP